MRQLQISLQNEFLDDVVKVLMDIGYENIFRLKSEDNSLLILRAKDTSVPKILEALNKIGVGTDFGLIDILPVEATIPRLEDVEKVEKVETEDPLIQRLAMEEIIEDLEKGAQPNFDYFIFIILSALVSGVGLINNSIVILIASMILSPLLGPILGLSLGAITKNKEMIRNSIMAQILGIATAIATGIILALIFTNLQQNAEITSEMAIRSYPSIFDIIVAFSAGFATGFSISGTVKSSLVGVAIALALMPPAVNIGIALMYGKLNLSFGSFILLLTNIIVINFASLLVMRLKKFRAIPRKRWFWRAPKSK